MDWGEITLVTLALIVLCYPIGAVILGKSSPDTGNDDVHLPDVLRGDAFGPRLAVLRDRSRIRVSAYGAIAIAEGKSRGRETFERGDGTSRAQPRRYAHKNEAIARSHKGDV
jgi:hypothetical protein